MRAPRDARSLFQASRHRGCPGEEEADLALAGGRRPHIQKGSETLLCPGNPGATRSRDPQAFGSGLLSTQGSLYPHLPSHSFNSLCSPNCGKADIMCLSAIAWPAMALRQACLWLGPAVYVALWCLRKGRA